MPFADLVRQRPGTLALASLVAIAPPAIGYTQIVYMLSYGTTVVGFSRTTLLALIFISTVPWMVTIYLAARTSDRMGAKPVYAVGAVTATGSAFLLFALVNTGNIAATLLAFIITGIVQGIMAGAQGRLFTEIFATRMRYSGVSIAYQLGGMIGGALTPIVATALQGRYDASLPVAAYVGGLAFVSFLAVVAMRAPSGESSAAARPARKG